jgi:(4-(4-[2-(gamma-L-glutamylamino)ethyl]phenoxymethyl)furan-2-yl)methanamine synthase
VLSLDIGGANTKTSFLCLNLARYEAESEPKYVKRYKNILKFSHPLFYSIQYFPFWQHKQADFKKVLNIIRKKAITHLLEHISLQYPDVASIYIKNTRNYYVKLDNEFQKKNEPNNESIPVEFNVVITITAELSDAFSTKQEGITVILHQLQEAFNPDFLKIINVEGKFIPVEEALKDYLSVSASNWIATSLVFGERERLGMLLDMGSTTLDIIPIKDGQPVTIGKNDVDRLLNYELFYTGVLRPPISSIVRNVPFRHTLCPVSFERFALMADVYSVLDLITEKDYTCDTTDGRGKSKKFCYARLARIICGDINLISEEEIDEIAKYIYKAHKELVQDAIRRAINEFTRRFVIPISKIRFNVTGLGAKILLIPALKNINIHDNQIFFKALTEQEHVLSTAICLGIAFLKNEVQKISTF